MSKLDAITSEADALSLFDTLPPVLPAQLIGLWHGHCVPTGHPLDGVLENLGWYGKRFHGDRRADALLFRWGERRLVPIDPAKIPVGLAMHLSGFGRSRAGHNLFSHLMRGLRAHAPVASVRQVIYRGVESAAMAYDRKPIFDHFRRLDEERLLGVMEIAGDDRHYVFVLQQVPES